MKSSITVLVLLFGLSAFSQNQGNLLYKSIPDSFQLGDVKMKIFIIDKITDDSLEYVLNTLSESHYIKNNFDNDTSSVLIYNDSIVFKIEKKKNVILIKNGNIKDRDNYVKYEYKGFNKQINSWLVYKESYESMWYLLIDKKDGAITSLCSPPTFSDDYSYFICSNSSYLDCVSCGNIFQYYIIENNKVKLKKELMPDKWSVFSVSNCKNNVFTSIINVAEKGIVENYLVEMKISH